MMHTNTLEIAKYIIKNCLDNNYYINTLKLEYLLVLAQGYMLVKYNKLLFNDEIILTNTGCKIKLIEENFLQYRIGFDKDIKEINLKKLTNDEQEIIDFVCNTYGVCDIQEISKLNIFKVLEKSYHPNKEFIIPIDMFYTFFKSFYILEEYKINNFLRLKKRGNL